MTTAELRALVRDVPPRMGAAHPITAASRRRQACGDCKRRKACVACSPCKLSSLDGGRR
jgi:hypothetical protein